MIENYISSKKSAYRWIFQEIAFLYVKGLNYRYACEKQTKTTLKHDSKYKKIRSFNFLLDRAMFNCSWSLPQMQLACAFRLLYLFKVSRHNAFFLFSVCECVNQLAFELLIKLCMAERECKCVSMHFIIQFNPIQSRSFEFPSVQVFSNVHYQSH